MAVGDYEVGGPLARARRVLRDAPEPGWDAIEADVIAAVRDTPRSGWPLTVVDPVSSPPQGVIVVTDLALKSSVAHALRGDSDFAVGAVEVAVDGTSVLAVRVELTGRYDADLNAAADRALVACVRVVDDVIGSVEAVPIDVVVTDVHR